VRDLFEEINDKIQKMKIRGVNLSLADLCMTQYEEGLSKVEVSFWVTNKKVMDPTKQLNKALKEMKPIKEPEDFWDDYEVDE
jgi:hypothetical protein